MSHMRMSHVTQSLSLSSSLSLSLALSRSLSHTHTCRPRWVHRTHLCCGTCERAAPDSRHVTHENESCHTISLSFSLSPSRGHVCCSVCLAVCCSMLQCVCCSVLQCVCCSVLQCVAVCVLQCVAVCVLQCVAVCCSVLSKGHVKVRNRLEHCNTLQHTATH